MKGHYVKLLYDYIVQLHLDRNNDDVARARARIEAGKMSELSAKGDLHRWEDTIRRAMTHPIILPPPPNEDEWPEGAPQVVLGKTETGLDWGISPLRSVRHMLVAGGTGAGKSSFLRRLVIGLRRLGSLYGQDVVVFLIDPKKDFTDVRTIALGPWLILDAASTLRWGNQPPDGVGPDAWVNTLCTSLEARTHIVSSRTTIARTIRILLDLLNRGSQRRVIWPNWQQVLEALNSAKPEVISEKAEYTRSARHAVTDLVINSARLFECTEGFAVNTAIRKGINSVVAVDQLRLPSLRHLLVELIASHIFLSSLAANAKTDRTQIVLVIDEADEFVSVDQDKVYPIGLSPFGQLLKQAREFGISVVLSVTVLRQVSPFVLSNTNDIVILTPADPDSTTAARRALMLPPESERTIAGLRPGQAIVRQSMSPVPYAFWVDLDYVPPYRGPALPFDNHPFTPATPLSQMGSILADTRKAFSILAAHTAGGITHGDLRKPSWQILTEAIKLPYLPLAQLAAELGGLSPQVIADAREELEEAGFAEFSTPRFGKNSHALIEATAAGHSHVGSQKPKTHGRGGLVHRHVATWLLWLGRRLNHESFIEYAPKDTTHSLDVAWLVDNRIQGFEICVECTSNLRHHAHACFLNSSEEISCLTIVTTQKQEQPELLAMLMTDADLKPFLARIKFLTVAQIMKELWP